MKIVGYINQNLPIWSMLCGDHALKNQIKLINSNLLEKPNFLSLIENSLRSEIFKSKRNWIYKKIGPTPSFALIEFTLDDLSKMQTCFADVSFSDYVNQYDKSFYTRVPFKIKKLSKTIEDVEEQYMLMAKLERKYFPVKSQDIVNSNHQNSVDISVALNRSLIFKEEGKFKILDGTHRLTAYYWSKMLQSNTDLPDKLFAFYCEAGY